jgi:hypothetical protein
MKIAIFAVISCVMLDGCVSEKTTLANAQGQQVHCDSWGFGIIGASVAAASHHHCVEQAHEGGYSEVQKPKED